MKKSKSLVKNQVKIILTDPRNHQTILQITYYRFLITINCYTRNIVHTRLQFLSVSKRKANTLITLHATDRVICE